MLFHMTWEYIDTSEAGDKRSLQLFSKWQPGPGRFQAFYGFADGTGGVAIVEADNAAEMAKTIYPWTPWLKFSTRPILPIEEAAAISADAIAWRESN